VIELIKGDTLFQRLYNESGIKCSCGPGPTLRKGLCDKCKKKERLDPNYKWIELK